MRIRIEGLKQLRKAVSRYLAIDETVLTERFFRKCFWALAANSSLDAALGSLKLTCAVEYDLVGTLQEFDYLSTFFTQRFYSPDHRDIEGLYEVVPNGHLSSLAGEAWDRLNNANYIDGLFCMSLLAGIFVSYGVFNNDDRPDFSPLLPAFRWLKHALEGTEPTAGEKVPELDRTYTLALHFLKQLPNFADEHYSRRRPSSLLKYYAGSSYIGPSDRALRLALARLAEPSESSHIGPVLDPVESDAVGPLTSALALALKEIAQTSDEERIETLVKPWRNRIVKAAAEAKALLAKEDRTAFALIDLASAGEVRAEPYRAALAEGAALEVRDESGKTALIRVAYSPDGAEVIRFLAGQGANVEAVDELGNSAVSVAATFHSGPELMAAVLSAASEPEQRRRLLTVALSRAVEARKLENLEWLVTACAQTDPNLPREATLLLRATEFDWEAGAGLLIKAGVDVNTSDTGGTTPLIQACQSASAGLVQLIIDAGADVDHHDDTGLTALMYASRRGELGCMRALLGAGAGVDTRSGNGCTALMFATHQGGSEAIKALLEAGANVDAQDEYGLTALMYACHPPYGYWPPHQISPLLAAGTDLEMRDNLGRTALMHAYIHRIHMRGAVEQLIEAGADENAKDFSGNSADDYLEDDDSRYEDIWYEFKEEEDMGWPPD